MKLQDLIKEARVLKHNIVRVSRVETALKKIFPENTPDIKNEYDGIYIILDIEQSRIIEEKGLPPFIVRLSGFFDDYHQLKKYTIEYIDIEKPELKKEIKSK